MYRSPIEVFLSQIEVQMEDGIMKAVQKQGIMVDKEELVKLLAYDRDQYSKGYREGRESAFKEIMERITGGGY